MTPDLTALLTSIDERLQRVEALLLERGPVRQSRSPAKVARRAEQVDREREQVAALLDALHAAIGQRSFTVASLQVETDVKLRSVLDALGLNPRQLGKLLARWTGEAVDYLEVSREVSREGSDADGAIWAVRSVFQERAETQKPSLSFD